MNKKFLIGIGILMGTSITGCSKKETSDTIIEDISTNSNNDTLNKETDTLDLSSNLNKAKSIYIENEKPLYLDGILVVNKEFSIPKNFASGLAPEVIEAFKLMKSDAEKEGIILNIRSGFRSYTTQEQLFNTYVQRDGIEKASRYSAKPGHSEHETGLAIDITDEFNNRSIGDWFNETEQAKWLYENAYKYGFILRYPESKEHITGYKYESWHYRYVGIEHSKNFAMNDLTLEEYLKIVPQE